MRSSQQRDPFVNNLGQNDDASVLRSLSLSLILSLTLSILFAVLSHCLLNFKVSTYIFIFFCSIHISNVIGSPLLRYDYGHNYVQIWSLRFFFFFFKLSTGLLPWWMAVQIPSSFSLPLTISFRFLTPLAYTQWLEVCCLLCTWY